MKFSREIMKGVTPFIILKTLHRLKEAYGYQLIKTIREESEGTFDFPDSTLYPILYRLEDRDLIESEVKEITGKKPRRYYWLTKKGLAHLGVKEEEMKHYIEGIKRFLPGATMA